MRAASGELPVPDVTDPDSGPFWAAAAEHRLVVAIGVDGTPVHPPRAAGSNTPIRWVDASGRATLHSWTVVRNTVDPSFPAPYTLVVVALEDYPSVRFVGQLEGEPSLSPGQPMQVAFDERSGATVPQWKPASSPVVPTEKGRA